MNFCTKIFIATLCCILVTKRVNAQDGYDDLDYSEELSNMGSYNPKIITFGPFSFGFEPPTLENIPEITTAAQALQNFSFDIFDSIHQDAPNTQQNMVISTLSIFTAMAMLRPGLKGESLRQMNDLFGNERLNNVQIGNTFDDIFSEDNKYELEYANGVYVDRSVLLRKSYKREISKLKVVLAKRVYFARRPNSTRTKINRYVSKKTRRLIEEMVPENGITARTKIYLINALYLKAKWGFQFSTRNTAMKPFYVDNENSIMTSTMHTDYAPCTFYHDDEHQADVTVLSLHENLSMLLIMPQDAGNFTTLFSDDESTMKNKFHQILSEVWSDENDGERILQACSLDMPKFSLESQTDLKNSLRRLGLRDVFDMTNANLSYMTQRRINNLYVSDALHKAKLTATEEGIEAAAATSLGISVRRAADVRVNVNKPFLFAIRQDITGAILFVGKVVRP